MSSERELTQRLYFIIMGLPSIEKEKEAISLIKRGANVLDVMNRIYRIIIEEMNDKIGIAVNVVTGTGALSDVHSRTGALLDVLNVMRYVSILENLIELAKKAGYDKMSPNKIDELVETVKNRDKINKENVLKLALPGDVTKKIMKMGGKTLKRKYKKRGEKRCLTRKH